MRTQGNIVNASKIAITAEIDTMSICKSSFYLPSGVGVSLHDHALDLANHAVVHRGHHRRRHLSNAHCHRLRREEKRSMNGNDKEMSQKVTEHKL